MHATEKVLQLDQLLLMRGQGLGHKKTPTTSAQALPAPVSHHFSRASISSIPPTTILPGIGTPAISS
jgi:hypothetical protein